MDDKKKTFIVPEAAIVNFSDEDIITASNNANWIGDDNMEDWE